VLLALVVGGIGHFIVAKRAIARQESF